MTSEERLEKNEELYREVNERIANLAGSRPDDSLEFVCECARTDCLEVIRLTLAEYEHIRAKPGRFVLVPQHLDDRVDVQVEHMNGYVIVFKDVD